MSTPNTGISSTGAARNPVWNPANHHFYELYDTWNTLPKSFRKSILFYLDSKGIHTFAPEELTKRFVGIINDFLREKELVKKNEPCQKKKRTVRVLDDGSFVVQGHILRPHDPRPDGTLPTRALIPVRGPSFIQMLADKRIPGSAADLIRLFLVKGRHIPFKQFAFTNTVETETREGVRIKVIKTPLLKELKVAKIALRELRLKQKAAVEEEKKTP